MGGPDFLIKWLLNEMDARIARLGKFTEAGKWSRPCDEQQRNSVTIKVVNAHGCTCSTCIYMDHYGSAFAGHLRKSACHMNGDVFMWAENDLRCLQAIRAKACLLPQLVGHDPFQNCEIGIRRQSHSIPQWRSGAGGRMGARPAFQSSRFFQHAGTLHRRAGLLLACQYSDVSHKIG